MKYLFYFNITNKILVYFARHLDKMPSSFNCWMCRHPNVRQLKDNCTIQSLVDESHTLECPICYEEHDFNGMFFTECKHYACFNCVNIMVKQIIGSVRSSYITIIRLPYFDDYIYNNLYMINNINTITD